MHTITQAHPSTLGSGIHMAKTTLSQQYFYSLYTVMKVAHLQFQQSHISDKKKKKKNQVPGQRNKWSQPPCHSNTLITP